MNDMLRHRRWPIGLMALLLGTAAAGCAPDDATRVARAEEHRTAGELQAAVIELKNVLQNDPVNVEARVLLARVSLQAGDAVSAAKEFERAVDLGADIAAFRTEYAAALLAVSDWERLLKLLEGVNGTSPEESGRIAAARAEAFMGLERPDEARDAVAAAVAAAPELPEARLAQARLALAEGLLGESGRLLDAMEPDLAEDSRYWELKARHSIRSADPDATVAAWQRAIEAAADEPAARSVWLQGNLVEAQLAAGDLEDARQSFAVLSASAPGSPVTQYLAGRIAFQEGNMEEALAKAQAVIAKQPSSAPALLLAGAAALKLGQHAQAESFLVNATKVDPDNAGARQLLAESRIGRGAPEQAMEALLPGLETGTGNTPLLGLLGRAGMLSGDNESAIAVYRRRLAEEPGDEQVRLFLAASLLAEGRNAEADEELAKSTSLDADQQLMGQYLTVVARLRAGNVAGARDAAAIVRRDRASDANALDVLGGLFLAANVRDEARGDFERALALDPEHASARLNLGRVLALEGDHEAARRQFESVLADQPDSIPTMIALGMLAERADDRIGALEWLEKARAADATALEPRLLLAGFHLEEQAFGEAEAVAREAVAARPESYQAANMLGVALMGLGNPADAREQFGRAADLAPLSAEMRYNLARAQLALGDAQKGRESLEAALAVDPGYANALALLTELDVRAGHLGEAARRYAALEAAAPDSPVTHLLEGDLLGAQGRYEDAERAYRAVLATTPNRRATLSLFLAKRNAGHADAGGVLRDWLAENPTDDGARTLLAGELQRTGDTAGAIASYEAILEDRPDNAAALNNLALLYQRAGDDRALATAEKAFELAPGSGAIADTVGWMYYERGDHARATELLTKAVELAPDEPEIRYHLAVVLADGGDKARARQMLETILASQQAVAFHDDAQDLLQRL